MSLNIELGVWGYQHFIFYLCNLTLTVHPCPQKHLFKRLELLKETARRFAPFDTSNLKVTPAVRGKRRVVGKAVNDICDVMWWWWRAETVPDTDIRNCYEAALSTARALEYEFLNTYLTMEQVQICAAHSCRMVWLHRTELPDDEQKLVSAAVAAMEAGHYDVAHDILTDYQR